MEFLSVRFTPQTRPKLRPEDLMTRHYRLYRVAVRPKDGIEHWVVVAEDAQGIAEFRAEFPNTPLVSRELEGARSRWIITAFPFVDDGHRDAVEIVETGLAESARQAEQRAAIRESTAQIESERQGASEIVEIEGKM